jgi:hypothetical protein
MGRAVGRAVGSPKALTHKIRMKAIGMTTKRRMLVVNANNSGLLRDVDDDRMIRTVSYKLGVSERRVTGRMLSNNQDAIIIAELTDFQWDGFTAIRTSCSVITNEEFDEVCERVIRIRGDDGEKAKGTLVQRESVVTLLDFIIDIPRERLVSVELRNGNIYFGKIASLESGRVKLCELGIDGVIDCEEEVYIPVKEIIRVRFGNAYLRGYELLQIEML